MGEGEREKEVFEKYMCYCKNAEVISARASLMQERACQSLNQTLLLLRQRRSSWTRTSSSIRQIDPQQKRQWQRPKRFARRKRQHTRRKLARIKQTLPLSRRPPQPLRKVW